MDVTETHQDILQNIEFAIVTAFDQDRTLLDLEVIDALDALTRRYAAECEHRAPPKILERVSRATGLSRICLSVHWLAE